MNSQFETCRLQKEKCQWINYQDDPSNWNKRLDVDTKALKTQLKSDLIFHDINQNCFSNLQHQIFSFFSPEGISCSVKEIHLLQQFQSPTSNSEGLKKKRTPPFHWEITSFSCTTTLTIWNSLLTLDILFSKKMHQLGWTTGSKTMLLLSKGKNKTGNFLYFSHHFCQKKKLSLVTIVVFKITEFQQTVRLLTRFQQTVWLFSQKLLDSNKLCDFSFKNF